jgi:hypothetical protein
MTDNKWEDYMTTDLEFACNVITAKVNIQTKGTEYELHTPLGTMKQKCKKRIFKAPGARFDSGTIGQPVDEALPVPFICYDWVTKDVVGDQNKLLGTWLGKWKERQALNEAAALLEDVKTQWNAAATATVPPEPAVVGKDTTLANDEWIDWYHRWSTAKFTPDAYNPEPTTGKINMIPMLRTMMFQASDTSFPNLDNSTPPRAREGKIVMLNCVRTERGPDTTRGSICVGTMSTLEYSDDLNPFSERNKRVEQWAEKCLLKNVPEGHMFELPADPKMFLPEAWKDVLCADDDVCNKFYYYPLKQQVQDSPPKLKLTKTDTNRTRGVESARARLKQLALEAAAGTAAPAGAANINNTYSAEAVTAGGKK